MSLSHYGFKILDDESDSRKGKMMTLPGELSIPEDMAHLLTKNQRQESDKEGASEVRQAAKPGRVYDTGTGDKWNIGTCALDLEIPCKTSVVGSYYALHGKNPGSCIKAFLCPQECARESEASASSVPYSLWKSVKGRQIFVIAKGIDEEALKNRMSKIESGLNALTRSEQFKHIRVHIEHQP